MTPDAPETQDLQAWAQTLEADNERLRVQISDLTRQLAQGEERLGLIQRLLEIEDPDATPKESVQGLQASPKGRTNARHVAPNAALEDAVAEILREAEAPMHISGIRAQLIDRGVPIPGRGEDANIIVKISAQGERFTRTARGTYALAEWGLPAVQRRRSKSRRTK